MSIWYGCATTWPRPESPGASLHLTSSRMSEPAPEEAAKAACHSGDVARTSDPSPKRHVRRASRSTTVSVPLPSGARWPAFLINARSASGSSGSSSDVSRDGIQSRGRSAPTSPSQQTATASVASPMATSASDWMFLPTRSEALRCTAAVERSRRWGHASPSRRSALAETTRAKSGQHECPSGTGSVRGTVSRSSGSSIGQQSNA
mmetsp:Transcript_13325/g.41189  ORF Transcript_13325/g.41189 Transcript_13325/m.41189 type:complete len:205 (-) Transcript_13325:496-1110(-)